MKKHVRRFADVLRRHIAIYGEVSDNDLAKLLNRAGVELRVPYAHVPHGTRCARCHRRLDRSYQTYAHNVYGPKCIQLMMKEGSVA